MGFSKKSWFLLKIAEGGKFAVECNWKSTVSQNVHILAFSLTKDCSFEKKLTFSKNSEGSKFVVEYDSINRISQNVQISRFWGKFNMFCEKKLKLFKITKVTKIALQNVSIMVGFRKDVFSALIVTLIRQNKNRKLWMLLKLENMMKKSCFFSRGKNVLIFQKSICTKIGRQNLPVLTGRLVIYPLSGKIFLPNVDFEFNVRSFFSTSRNFSPN